MLMKQPVFSELVKYFWSIPGFIGRLYFGIFRGMDPHARLDLYHRKSILSFMALSFGICESIDATCPCKGHRHGQLKTRV